MKIVGLLLLLSLTLGVSTAFAAKTWKDFPNSGVCPGTMRKVANVANCGCRGRMTMQGEPVANCAHRHGHGGGRGHGGHGHGGHGYGGWGYQRQQ
jgi:hypothetical protein